MKNPDSILPTLGGQAALNLAMELVESGYLEKFRSEIDRYISIYDQKMQKTV